ncbi:hypothetical protein N8592_02960, partial [Verrucomicrobia bacterium]|nr:hypothetical protein [Verrucomicrobiota bacterium]
NRLGGISREPAAMDDWMAKLLRLMDFIRRKSTLNDDDGSSKTIKVAIIVRLFQKKLARDDLSTHDGPC